MENSGTKRFSLSVSVSLATALLCLILGACQLETEPKEGTASVLVRNDSSVLIRSIRLWHGVQEEDIYNGGLAPGQEHTLTVHSKYNIEPYYTSNEWFLNVRTSEGNTFTKEDFRLIDGMTRKFSFNGTRFNYIQ